MSGINAVGAQALTLNANVAGTITGGATTTTLPTGAQSPAGRGAGGADLGAVLTQLTTALGALTQALGGSAALGGGPAATGQVVPAAGGCGCGMPGCGGAVEQTPRQTPRQQPDQKGDKGDKADGKDEKRGKKKDKDGDERRPDQRGNDRAERRGGGGGNDRARREDGGSDRAEASDNSEGSGGAPREEFKPAGTVIGEPNVTEYTRRRVEKSGHPSNPREMLVLETIRKTVTTVADGRGGTDTKVKEKVIRTTRTENSDIAGLLTGPLVDRP